MENMNKESDLRKSALLFCLLVITLNVPAKEHSGTSAQDVESGTLLLNQGSTLGGETMPLSLCRGLDS
ncbi:hypothetical protein DITRI_Ditri02bG0067000 [Diplodiscus trichospermus]